MVERRREGGRGSPDGGSVLITVESVECSPLVHTQVDVLKLLTP